MKQAYALVFALMLMASGCSVTVDHMEANAFTRGARAASRQANDQTANAVLLLRASIAPDQVEAVLRGSGISAEEAHHIVLTAQAVVKEGR